MKNAKLTRRINSKGKLNNIGNIFDTFITDSDQVWNMNSSGGETTYFLDFVNGKPKKSYVTSFGDLNLSVSQYV